jgi:hypothetical protein
MIIWCPDGPDRGQTILMGDHRDTFG